MRHSSMVFGSLGTYFFKISASLSESAVVPPPSPAAIVAALAEAVMLIESGREGTEHEGEGSVWILYEDKWLV